MKRRENATFKMIRCIVAFLKEHDELGVDVPALLKAVSELSVRVDLLWEHLRLASLTTVGVTLDKHKIRKQLILEGLMLSKLVKTAAREANDMDLYKAAHSCYSDWHRATDSALVLRCQLVKNLAMKVKNLERYGKSKALLKDFVDLSKNYFDDADKNKVFKHDAARHHAEAKRLLRECVVILKDTIDPLIEVQSMKHDRACGVYFGIRRVYSVGRKKKGFKKVVIKDKLTGAVIEGVKINVVEQAEQLLANFKGEMDALRALGFKLLIEKEGYKPLVIERNDFNLEELSGEMEPVYVKGERSVEL